MVFSSCPTTGSSARPLRSRALSSTACLRSSLVHLLSSLSADTERVPRSLLVGRSMLAFCTRFVFYLHIFESERLLVICLQVVLVLSIAVQVTMFLIIASLALWVDELFGGAVASLSKTTNIFKGIAIVSLILALPWFILVRSHLTLLPFSLTNFRAQCWIAVRKENKSLMVAFFFVTTFFIASLCSMFGSDAFRLILPTWPFFRSLTIASLCGLIISFGLSIWCRLRFGRGLASQRTWSLSENSTRGADPLSLGSRS